MSWARGLEALFALFIVLAIVPPSVYRRLAFRIRLARNRLRVRIAANRRRRGVLPAPSDKCRRDYAS